MQKSFFNLKIFFIWKYIYVYLYILALQVVTERHNYKVCKTPARLEKVFLFLFRLSRLTIISDIIYVTVDVHFTWRSETIFWFLLQWLTLVTSLTVVSTGKTVVQVTNKEETSSSNCPPTASGRLSPLSMLSKHWNKININYTCFYWMIMNRWIDEMTDRWTNRQGDS